ncbi:MAG: hypothetical protein HRT71_18045 [Flavobacteriales bacterium]|nr:hypothetical protein [Flavobacteriales bacterium]
MRGISNNLSIVPANDSMLVKMVEQDMKSRKVKDYFFTDELVSVREDGSKTNTQFEIKVGSNEAVYVYHLFTTPNFYDNLIISSATSSTTYNDQNTPRVEWGDEGIGVSAEYFESFASNRISKHFSDVLVDVVHRHNGPNGGRFVIRYVRVNYIPRKKKQDGSK